MGKHVIEEFDQLGSWEWLPYRSGGRRYWCGFNSKKVILKNHSKNRLSQEEVNLSSLDGWTDEMIWLAGCWTIIEEVTHLEGLYWINGKLIQPWTSWSLSTVTPGNPQESLARGLLTWLDWILLFRYMYTCAHI